MLALQASTFGTSKHAFSADGGRTTTSSHYTARSGKDDYQNVLVEPGTGNIYAVGDRYTNPSEDGNTPTNHYSRRASLIKFDRMGKIDGMGK